MSNNNWLMLTSKLLVRSRDRSVTWDTDEGGEVYRTQIGLSTVTITKDRVGDVIMTLGNEDGRQLERFDFGAIQADLFDDDIVRAEAEELYEIARRQALGIDKLWDNVFESLG